MGDPTQASALPATILQDVTEEKSPKQIKVERPRQLSMFVNKLNPDVHEEIFKKHFFKPKIIVEFKEWARVVKWCSERYPYRFEGTEAYQAVILQWIKVPRWQQKKSSIKIVVRRVVEKARFEAIIAADLEGNVAIDPYRSKRRKMILQEPPAADLDMSEFIDEAKREEQNRRFWAESDSD
ncbi:uncharacterized protein LY89DRAFT_739859 [Mollisia scopiformis]|uniref:Uncharacterized protein n=1 Tax=Mollisia scopiformis TaxID=149040 RepID=A0A194WSD7_MOLSC|nr:uncharacterized protein LY89DRAFT_739859 [Mollisia scopiformis]KUJ10878.1 hypothetical protein LY89DRAFT_739859 [Mollisia scopiformis]